MQDMDQAVAEEVRAMVARRRISQKRLAESLDMTPMALSRRLSGAVSISAGELIRLADVLGCRPSELLPHLDSNQEHFDYQSQQEDDYPFQSGWELAA